MSRAKWKSLICCQDSRRTFKGATTTTYFLKVADFHDHDHRCLQRVSSRGHTSAGEMCGRLASEISRAYSYDTNQASGCGRTSGGAKRVVLARRAISMVGVARLWSWIFSRSVLCGVVRSRPGDVSSSYSSRTVVHVRPHPFLSYDRLRLTAKWPFSVLADVALCGTLPAPPSTRWVRCCVAPPKPTDPQPAGRAGPFTRRSALGDFLGLWRELHLPRMAAGGQGNVSSFHYHDCLPTRE